MTEVHHKLDLIKFVLFCLPPLPEVIITVPVAIVIKVVEAPVQPVVLANHQRLHHCRLNHLPTRCLDRSRMPLSNTSLSPHARTVRLDIIESIEEVVVVVPLPSALLVMVVPLHVLQ